MLSFGYLLGALMGLKAALAACLSAHSWSLFPERVSFYPIHEDGLIRRILFVVIYAVKLPSYLVYGEVVVFAKCVSVVL